MKNNIIVLLALATLLSGCSSAIAQHSQNKLSDKPLQSIAPYPAAKKGFSRHVIYLPPLADESLVKVELLLGKTMKVDCNHHSLDGKLERKTIPGWGYDYFELDETLPVISTMMACPGQQDHEKFVMIYNANELVRYNSKLPIVIYAPNDIEVKYRIWQAGNDIQESVVK